TQSKTLIEWLSLWKKPKINNLNKDISHAKKSEPKTNSFFNANSLINELDHNNLPKQKIAIISGENGSFRSTLCHIAAKTANLNLITLNGQLDCAGEDFKNVIAQSLTSLRISFDRSQSQVLNCIVIDDADQLPKKTLNYLESLLNQKTSNQKFPLILVVDSLFNQKLASLKNLALHIHCEKPSDSDIANILVKISNSFEIDISTLEIMDLAKNCSRNIRSCINMMQFFVDTNVSKYLDTNIGLNTLLLKLFSKKYEKTTKVYRIDEIIQGAYQIDNFDIVNFQSFFLALKSTTDINFNKVRNILDCFGIADILDVTIGNIMNFSLKKYQLLAIISIFIAKSVYHNKITEAKADYFEKIRMKKSKAELEKSLSKLRQESHSKIFQHCSGYKCLFEYDLYYINLILSPKFKNSSMYAMKSHEKKKFEKIRTIMKDLGLYYCKKLKNTGQSSRDGTSQREDFYELNIDIFSALLSDDHVIEARKLNSSIKAALGNIALSEVSGKNETHNTTEAKRDQKNSKREISSCMNNEKFNSNSRKKIAALYRKFNGYKFEFVQGYTNAVKKSVKFENLFN
ncbi:MAG: Chromosome transmission fidelity protein 18, partial [Paramarteilia canceri]